MSDVLKLFIILFYGLVVIIVYWGLMEEGLEAITGRDFDTSGVILTCLVVIASLIWPISLTFGVIKAILNNSGGRGKPS